MRPTDLQFRDPRERNAPYYDYQDFLQLNRKKYTFTKAPRFQKSNQLRGVTPDKIGPGSYDSSLFLQRKSCQSPVYVSVYMQRRNIIQTGNPAFHYIGNRIVFDEQYAKILPTRYGHHSQTVSQDQNAKINNRYRYEIIRPIHLTQSLKFQERVEAETQNNYHLTQNPLTQRNYINQLDNLHQGKQKDTRNQFKSQPRARFRLGSVPKERLLSPLTVLHENGKFLDSYKLDYITSDYNQVANVIL